MKPTRSAHATLVDLLDRVLDKGLVVSADIIVSVAGVPLIGVNLRAALAGVETMTKYGLMTDWLDRGRAREMAQRQKGGDGCDSDGQGCSGDGRLVLLLPRHLSHLEESAHSPD